jgi:transcriptional regulator with PAS, ATPase and Fis domain
MTVDALPSPQMRRLRELVDRIAPTDSTVLITGESGVGKEQIARRLHRESPRRRAPFLAINGGAFADTLLETELFGHVRGAFTGALQDRAGLFEAAHGGTLFLDEIGEVSPAMQVRLLRVLQEREVRRVGDTAARTVDVRLIAATNRDLTAEIALGRFRADLYYRLRVIDLYVPPLRDRPSDLALLMDRLLVSVAARVRRPIEGYTKAARDLMLGYSWPGNIRELEHAIERGCALARGTLIEPQDLPEALNEGAAPASDDPGRPAARGAPERIRPLWEVEREYLQIAVARCRGNRRRAADALQISVATLRRKLAPVAKSGAPAIKVGTPDHS